MRQERQVAPVVLARSQSVDGRHARTAWRLLRRLVHLRYVRAVVAAVCVVTILGSVGALAVAVKHDVSAVAVFRYFVRAHADEDDLGRRLRNGSTAHQLEPLLLLPPGVHPVGLLYANEGGLAFHTHQPRRQPGLKRAKRERAELFGRLAQLYWNADLDGMAHELNRPSVRQTLLKHGAEIKDLYAFQRYNGTPVDPRARTRMLRSAARQIRLIAPYLPEPFKLGFAEELRFYEHQSPEGKYVGRWEVTTPDPFGRIDAELAHGLSTNNHYIVISRFGERLRLSDFYRGTRTDYLVHTTAHASGRTLFRLAAQPAS